MGIGPFKYKWKIGGTEKYVVWVASIGGVVKKQECAKSSRIGSLYKVIIKSKSVDPKLSHRYSGMLLPRQLEFKYQVSGVPDESKNCFILL